MDVTPGCKAPSPRINFSRRGLLAAAAALVAPVIAPTAHSAQASTSAAAEGPMTRERAGQLIAGEAKRHRHKRYSMRGIGPRSFNCAGFSYYVVRQSLNVDISYFLEVQYKEGDPVARHAIEAGDLVFFKGTQGDKKGPTHVGIALGNSRMIHAANLKEDVTIDRIDKYRKHYLGARRLDPAKYFG